MAVPPRAPWYRRNPWGYGHRVYGPYAERPYPGCGCVYTAVLFVALLVVAYLVVGALAWL